MSDLVYVIKPTKKLDFARVKELVSCRELLYFFVWRDLKIRYRQTLLGVFWLILQPVLMMGLYSVIFGSFVKLPQGSYPYAFFVLSGLIPWTFISNSISDSGNSLLANAHLVSKVYFPRIYLPLARILVLLFDFIIASILLIFAALCVRVQLSMTLFLIPIVFILCVFMSLGVGALFSALNVKYRDFHYIIPFSLQILMFSTPIIYPVESIPVRFRWILDLNPLTGIIETYRVAFLGGELRPTVLIYSTVVSMSIFLSGLLYFNHVEHRFADII